MLAEKPDIVIGTPSRLLAHIQAENLDIKTSLEMIVIDEADLVFSFGYEENVRAILRYNLKLYSKTCVKRPLKNRQNKDLKDICVFFRCAHFLRRETGKVGLGPVFPPSKNSDRYIFLILLFQNDVLALS